MSRISTLVWAAPMTLALLVLAKGMLDGQGSTSQKREPHSLVQRLAPPGRLHAPIDARPVVEAEPTPNDAVSPASTDGPLSLTAPKVDERRIQVIDVPRQAARPQLPPAGDPPILYPIVEQDERPQLDEAFPGERPIPTAERLPGGAKPALPSGSTFAAQAPAPAGDVALSAVREQIAAMNERAQRLAKRGAMYSARAELLEALRLLAQSHDAQTGATERTKALTAALTAMDEADDFTPSKAGSAVSPSQIILAHQTPVLKRIDATRLAPLTCSQHYFAYAQQQLAQAVAGQSAAANTLSLLGMIHGHLASQPGGSRGSHVARAIVLHQATLALHPQHYQSANELGVLWARCGEWTAARDVLLTSLKGHPTPSAWHNLATVHDHLGEPELARLARNEARLLSPRTPVEAGMPTVEWVDAATFAAKSPGETPPSADRNVRVSAASHAAAPNTAVRR